MYTDHGVFRGEHVIVTLPLGVLQQNKVTFVPELPKDYRGQLENMGNGYANKLFVSFEKPFWGKKKGWLNFITKGAKSNPFPIAAILPAKNRNILCFFIAGSTS